MHRNILKNLLQNHLAPMLEIWYVALPSGPLPSSVEGPTVQDGQGVLVSNHRNSNKNIQKSSSSEPLGSDA